MEDVVDETRSGSCAELSSTGSKAYEQVHIGMKYVCMVCDVQCQWQFKAFEQSCENITEDVHAVI